MKVKTLINHIPAYEEILIYNDNTLDNEYQGFCCDLRATRVDAKELLNHDVYQVRHGISSIIIMIKGV